MSLFKNFNTHTLRTTRGFKLKQSSPISSPQQQLNSALPDLGDNNNLNNPYQTINLANNNNSNPNNSTIANNNGTSSNPQLSSHKDVRTYAEQTLGSSNGLIQAVKLPVDEDVNEWLAIHVVDFYNQINMLYGAITEFCSPLTCPRMIATEEYEYLWQEQQQQLQQDGVGGNPKRPVSLPACEYIENLMNWVQGFFDNENIFPLKPGAPFPQQFPQLVKTVFKRLFRVYAHIYCHHFHEISELGLQSHLNTSLKHYVLFANEFSLISPKDYGPLEDLVDTMLRK